MKRITLGGLAAAAIAAQIAVIAAPVSAAQPTTTTHSITVNAASETAIDLPALNSQFKSMTITVNGSANWGAQDLGYWTSYDNGTWHTAAPMIHGAWGDISLPGHGPLLLEGVQVGVVIYRVDGGQWHEVTTAPISVSEGTHVQVAYNDRPGSYDDNFGSLSLTVVRSK